MNYGALLLDTWKILWKHKAIFAFGLVTILVPTLFGMAILAVFAFSPAMFNLEFGRWMSDYPFIWISVELAIGALSLLATAVGYAAILRGTQLAESGAAALPFGDLWIAAWPVVGRVTGLYLLISVGMGIVFMVPALLGVLTAGIGFLCLFPFFFVLFPLAILMQAVLSLSMSAAVADDQGVFAALSRAWQVSRTNFWPVVIVALILYALQMAASFLLSIPMAIFPFALMPMMMGSGDPEAAFQVFAVLLLVMMPLLLIVQTLVMTYTQSAWMLAYLRLTRPAPVAEPADPAGAAELPA